MPELPITHPVLTVGLALLLFLIAPYLAERFRLPGIIGLLIAGALFGPNALGLLERQGLL